MLAQDSSSVITTSTVWQLTNKHRSLDTPLHTTKIPQIKKQNINISNTSMEINKKFQKNQDNQQNHQKNNKNNIIMDIQSLEQ